MTHFPQIDGLRAVAVLAVIVFHAKPGWLPGGFAGVDIFFAISGFVVTAALAQHREQTLGSFIAGFYHRRLTRILPALLVVLLATSLVWVLLVPRAWLSQQAERVGLFAFAGLSNWALADQSDAYFAPRAEFNPFTHTWSLGVEEQFYLIAPWLIFLGLRARQLALTTMALLSGLSLAGALVLAAMQSPQAFYSIASRFWELAAGALWYFALWHGKTAPVQPFPDAALRVWQLAALALLGATLWLVSAGPLPSLWAMGAVGGSLLAIGTPRTAGSRFTTVLSSPWLRWIGLRSYSLYLWHWPIFVLMRWTVGLGTAKQIVLSIAATFIAAEVSYRWVERPLRVSARWHRAPAFVTIASFVCASAIAFLAAQEMFARRGEWSLSTVERHRIDWYALPVDPTLPAAPDCTGGELRYRPLGGQTLIEHLPCGKLQGPWRGQVFVLGDSHATSFLPIFNRLARDESVRVVVYPNAGCPYVPLYAPMGWSTGTRCVDLPRAALQDLYASAKPGDVVVLASLRLPRFADQWGGGDPAAVWAAHFSEAHAKLRDEAVADADAWIRPLLDRGLRVVITAPLPIFRSPAYRCADRWTKRNPVCKAGTSESRQRELEYRAPVMAAMTKVVANQHSDRISVFDPFNALCPGELCHAIQPEDKRPLFHDGDHLSRWGNQVVYPAFRAHWQCVAGGQVGCGK